ncbi:M20/M25/M40 family metallo-hydrolase [Isachenkonia alkalipeptolytica]|uniref:M20/M25/M40 family metallo-hydrolase n=1 Tax=Isachenkonia alkalipeptolytica TaxID=2565777 RepID=A0AA44BF07_9CLOT|nr:M20/M25/M40 family metallo-hydrolase [Isachenkonia alkalipeptolytica]NBG88091.1 M20/M25/M40 family metallo-hydrolase [Isachenkonia alkalipeptolytica]
MLSEKQQKIIESIFYRLVAIRSDTNSIYEPIIEDVILNWFREREYFQENPEYFGTEPLEDDAFRREVVWALVRGEGKETVVLIHHHDAVGIEEYGSLEDMAFRPEELKEALKSRVKKKAVLRDLQDENWIFGRGTADMKSGAALQMGVVDHFTKRKDFKGNLLILSVPDEETISKGMLQGVELLHKLHQKYGLNYKLAINSEPYFNNVRDKALYYEGSVGKVMPIIYAKGVTSHISNPYNGISPSMIMANIQRRTELNPGLCDVHENDATPPPMWVHLKDQKKVYDASIPEAAVGFFNWLTFVKEPHEILESLKEFAQEAVTETLVFVDGSYQAFCEMNHQDYEPIDYSPIILDFEEAYEWAKEDGGERFVTEYEETLFLLKQDFKDNKVTLPELSVKLIALAGEHINIEEPVVIIGLSGPYYPHINNHNIIGDDLKLDERLNRITKQYYNFAFQKNEYFMGMSDLSYCGFTGKPEDIAVIKRNSPGWDEVYSIPFKEMQKLNMKVVNIGPWGKDLHQRSERVYAPDVFERIPTIIKDLIEEVLTGEEQSEEVG